MRRIAKRDQDITDLPQIRLDDARHFLGIGIPAWRDKWDAVYKFKIRHWETTKGVILNLDSAVSAIYPDFAKDPLSRARIANDFMFNVIRHRLLLREVRARKKAAKENDEGEK